MLLSIGMLMLSATQIYTIVTVQLFAFLNLLPVEADILAYNLENGTQTFDDLPARFGYRLPAEGLKYLIQMKMPKFQERNLLNLCYQTEWSHSQMDLQDKIVGGKMKLNKEIQTQEECLNHVCEFMNMQQAGTFKERAFSLAGCAFWLHARHLTVNYFLLVCLLIVSFFFYYTYKFY